MSAVIDAKEDPGSLMLVSLLVVICLMKAVAKGSHGSAWPVGDAEGG